MVLFDGKLIIEKGGSFLIPEGDLVSFACPTCGRFIYKADLVFTEDKVLVPFSEERPMGGIIGWKPLDMEQYEGVVIECGKV